MQALLFLEVWGPIFSFSSFWARKCCAFWRHGFAKREVVRFRCHRMNDFTIVGNHWKSLGMRLDIFPTWLQTQIWSAPKSNPSCIAVWSQTCFMFAFFNVIWTKHWKTIGPPTQKSDNLYSPTQDQQLILTAAHIYIYIYIYRLYIYIYVHSIDQNRSDQNLEMVMEIAKSSQDMNGISLSLLPYSSQLAPWILAPCCGAWPKAVAPQFPSPAPVQVKAPVADPMQHVDSYGAMMIWLVVWHMFIFQIYIGHKNTNWL